MASGSDDKNERTREWVKDQNRDQKSDKSDEDVDWEEIKRKEFERRRKQGWKRVILKPGVDTSKPLREGIDYEYAKDDDERSNGSSRGSYKSDRFNVSSIESTKRSSASSWRSEATAETSLDTSLDSYHTKSQLEKDVTYFPAIYDGIPVRLRKTRQ